MKALLLLLLVAAAAAAPAPLPARSLVIGGATLYTSAAAVDLRLFERGVLPLDDGFLTPLEVAVLCYPPRAPPVATGPLFAHLPLVQLPGVPYYPLTARLGEWAYEAGDALRCEVWECDGNPDGGCDPARPQQLPSAAAGDDLLAEGDLAFRSFQFAYAGLPLNLTRPGAPPGTGTAAQILLECDGCVALWRRDPGWVNPYDAAPVGNGTAAAPPPPAALPPPAPAPAPVPAPASAPAPAVSSAQGPPAAVQEEERGELVIVEPPPEDDVGSGEGAAGKKKKTTQSVPTALVVVVATLAALLLVAGATLCIYRGLCNCVCCACCGRRPASSPPPPAAAATAAGSPPPHERHLRVRVDKAADAEAAMVRVGATTVSATMPGRGAWGA